MQAHKKHDPAAHQKHVEAMIGAAVSQSSLADLLEMLDPPQPVDIYYEEGGVGAWAFSGWLTEVARPGGGAVVFGSFPMAVTLPEEESYKPGLDITRHEHGFEVVIGGQRVAGYMSRMYVMPLAMEKSEE